MKRLKSVEPYFSVVNDNIIYCIEEITTISSNTDIDIDD